MPATGGVQILPGAEPFRMGSSKERGALLLHGFGSTPFEMRYLGERLAAAGYTAVCPLLPGHGTNLDFFARTTWRDWYDTAATTLGRLAREVDRVVVVGQSMGALLALRLAVYEQVAALGCLATPLELTPLSDAAIRLFSSTPLRLLRIDVPKPGGVDIREPRLRRGLPGYQEIPMSAAASFKALQREVRRLLPRITSPLVAIHGRDDHTAPRSNAELLVREARATTRRLVILPNSYHVVSLDLDKTQVADELVSFFDQALTGRKEPKDA